MRARTIVFALVLGIGTGHAIFAGEERATPPCQWIDVIPYKQQMAPGGVTPGPRLAAGSYTLWVAAKRENPASDYASWRSYGPFDLVAGRKYVFSVHDGQPPILALTTEERGMDVYSSPGEWAGVFYHNDTESGKTYGIAVCPTSK